MRKLVVFQLFSLLLISARRKSDIIKIAKGVPEVWETVVGKVRHEERL